MKICQGMLARYNNVKSESATLTLWSTPYPTHVGYDPPCFAQYASVASVPSCFHRLSPYFRTILSGRIVPRASRTIIDAKILSPGKLWKYAYPEGRTEPLPRDVAG